MLSWRILLLIVYASSVTDGALKIVPIYATFNVAEGASASVTCTNLNAQAGEQPQWIDPYSRPIGTYGGGGSLDMYVVHSIDPETAQKVTRLQINNIIESWEGGYDCQANGDAESININVFSKCLLIICTCRTNFSLFLKYRVDSLELFAPGACFPPVFRENSIP